MKNNLFFHVHSDIGYAVKFYNMPISIYSENDVYILQEDRCVFVGSAISAITFIAMNEGKFIQAMYKPIRSVKKELR